ncbi:MAG: tetratricopeptide repeat protein [Nitrososphaeraceae archaeon]
MWNHKPPENNIKSLKLSASTILLTSIFFLFIISFSINTIPAEGCRDTDQETKGSDNNEASRLLNKGVDFAEIGKYEKAIEYYDQALDEDPNFAKAFYNKGINLLKLNKNYAEDAIQLFDQALDEDPNYASALYSKGLSLEVLGKYQEAIKIYDQALEEDPNFAKALYGKGMALYSLGKYEEAIQLFDQALDEDPNCDRALKWKNRAQENLDNSKNIKSSAVKPVNTPIKSTDSVTVNQDQQQISSPTSITDELTKLANLRDQGIITEEEFNQLKHNLINGGGTTNVETE